MNYTETRELPKLQKQENNFGYSIEIVNAYKKYTEVLRKFDGRDQENAYARGQVNKSLKKIEDLCKADGLTWLSVCADLASCEL